MAFPSAPAVRRFAFRALPAIALPLALLAPAEPALARDPLALAAPGRTLTLPLAALEALPAVTREVTFLTSQGEEHARYTGASLWSVLVGNGLVDPADLHALIRQVVIVTGGDGYVLVLSAGELAPELGAAPILLVHQRDGAPLPAARSPRLVVPGDRRGARQVFDVARIEVRTLPEPPTGENP
ncbi:hypothetical protein [Ancylobacter mangrovi]|uniref:hypothetical protein n=1 Tax=Ancylobacter mangrovi TaxID=2972472 RepID=UPI0021634F42|nr:hypothetical protein [Ancylobacter mangrovi]MCS0501076.1 hypothetical protein [Ancylobacter mangrovi]